MSARECLPANESAAVVITSTPGIPSRLSPRVLGGPTISRGRRLFLEPRAPQFFEADVSGVCVSLAVTCIYCHRSATGQPGRSASCKYLSHAPAAASGGPGCPAMRRLRVVSLTWQLLCHAAAVFFPPCVDCDARQPQPLGAVTTTLGPVTTAWYAAAPLPSPRLRGFLRLLVRALGIARARGPAPGKLAPKLRLSVASSFLNLSRPCNEPRAPRTRAAVRGPPCVGRARLVPEQPLGWSPISLTPCTSN